MDLLYNEKLKMLEKLDIEIINKTNQLKELELKKFSSYKLSENFNFNNNLSFITLEKKMFIDLVVRYMDNRHKLNDSSNLSEYFCELDLNVKDFNELIKNNIIKEYSLFDKKTFNKIKVYVIMDANKKMKFMTYTRCYIIERYVQRDSIIKFFSFKLNYSDKNIQFNDIINSINKLYCTEKKYLIDNIWKNHETDFINMSRFLSRPEEFEII